uniref:CSON009309 protein n=1 Tax=Culicoides sonorensis TaxID=179676 RepID=A0A336N0Z9_CULSO
MKKSHNYLLTFLFVTMFSLVVYSLDTLLDSFAHPWSNFIRFLLIVTYMYFWLCVQSLYQKYRRLDPVNHYLLA